MFTRDRRPLQHGRSPDRRWFGRSTWARVSALPWWFSRVILFHRLENRAIVDSLDALTGKRMWSAEYPTLYRDDFGFDEGPRGTPAVAGDRIYTFGAEGVLQALDFATGKRVWSIDFKQKFEIGRAHV